MITDFDFVATQIGRLMGLDGFPHGAHMDTAREELVLAATQASTPDVLELVISDWLKEQRKSPKPSDLHHLIANENEKIKPPERAIARPTSGHCPTCQDTGIRESIEAGDINSVASYCDCSAGRRRRNSRDEYPPERINAARERLRRIEARGAAQRSFKEAVALNLHHELNKRVREYQLSQQKEESTK